MVHYRKTEENADIFIYTLFWIFRVLMRKFAFFLSFFIFLAVSGWGQTTFTWYVDAPDTSWNDPGNWRINNATTSLVPGNGDNIIVIPTSGHYPNVPAGITNLGDVTMTNADIWVFGNLGIDNLSVSSGANFYYNPASVVVTANRLTMDGSLSITGALQIIDLYVSGTGVVMGGGSLTMHGAPVTITAAAVTINNAETAGNINVNNKSVTISTITGPNPVTIGAVTTAVNGNITININNTGTATLGNVYASNISSFLTINVTSSSTSGTLNLGSVVSQGSVAMNVNGAGTKTINSVNSFDLNGSMLIDAGRTVIMGSTPFWVDTMILNGTLSLVGTDNQTISGTATAGGTVIFTGNGTRLGWVDTFNDLRIEGGNRFSSYYSITVNNITITAGSLNMNNFDFNAAGNVTGPISNINTFSLTGSGTQNISFGAPTAIGSLNQINAGTVTINDSLTVNGNAYIRGTVIFANGSTQTMHDLFLYSGAEVRSVTAGSRWNLNAVGSSVYSSPVMPVIRDCASSTFLGLEHNTDAIDGGNNIRVFSGGTYTWTGGTSTLWSVDTNWNVSGSSTPYFPPVNDHTSVIIIPAVPRNPEFDNGVSCGSLTIASGMELNLHQFYLNVDNVLDNSGTILLRGTQSVYADYPLGYPGGTIRYQGNAVSPWSFGGEYTNLVVDSGLTMGAVGGALTVHGTAQINSNISAVSVNITGTAEINANINTSGNQNYGVIALGAALHTLTSTSGSVTASGNVTGTAGVTINASQGITMTNSNLGVALGGVVSLNNNQTAPAGAVNFNSTANVTIGGINNYGAFSVMAAGMTVNGITATGRAVSLASTAAVTQNAAAIACGSLSLSGNTSFVLTNTANNVTTLETASVYPASVNFTDANGFSIGSGGLHTQAGGSVTLRASGAVTQSGIIDTSTLSLSTVTAGAITLNTQNNKVQNMSITGAAGAVNFRNFEQTLNITGINAGGQNVTVEVRGTTGDLVVNGAVSNTGVLTLNSDHDLQITAAGSVVASTARAVLTAVNTVTVNGNINITGNGAPGHTVNDAAIYISAGTFAGTGSMTPGTAGQVCVYLGSALNYTGSADNRIHYHTNGKHLVYGNGAVDPAVITFPDVNSSGAINAGTYVYIRSDINLGAAISFSTSAGYNIYIIDVGNNAPANAREASFSAGGYIEIRGAYTSSNALNLSGTGVRLNDSQGGTASASLDLPSFNLTSPAMPLLLYGGTGANFANIKAAHINLGTVNGAVAGANNLHLDISGAAGNTNTLSSGATGALSALGDIQVISDNSAAGAVAFTAAVTANSYTQTGTGSSRFNGIQTYTGNFSFTGAALAVNASVQAVDVTVTNSGVFSLASGANIQYNGSFTQSGGGSSSLAANITTTAAAGTINFANLVTLAAAVSLNAGTGTVVLGSAVGSIAAGTNNLTITGNASLNGSSNAIGALNVTGDAGFLTAAFSAASVTVSGTSTVNVNINTVNNQSYTGMVLGAAQHTFTSTNGSIIASGNVTGTAGVIINASQGITITNSGAGTALGGNVQLNNNQTGIAPANAVNFITAANVTISGINNAGAFNVTAADMTVNGITANGRAVSLASTAAVTQNAAGAAAIACNTLSLSGSAGFTLNNAANNVTSLETGAAVPTAVSYTDSNAFSIGANGMAASISVQLTTIAAGTGITGTGTAAAGSITTPSLTVNSAGSITLTNTTNNVAALQITGAAGTAAFTNAAALTVAGISGSANDVLIRTESGSITVSGNISSVRLSLTAVGDDDVTVNSGSVINVTGTGVCGTGAAIYVNARNFFAPGTGFITPGVTGQLCLMINGTPQIASSRISPERYHIHPRNHGHLVYGRGTAPANGSIQDGNGNTLDNSVIGREYVYINSEQPNLPDVYYVEADRNIYIIEIGHNNVQANARDITFIVDAGPAHTGWIEIRGNYASSGLALEAGSGGIRLLDANVIVTAGSFNVNGSRLMLGHGSSAASNERIEASSIIIDNGIYGNVTNINHLTLRAAGNITVTGTAGTNAIRLGNVRVESGTAVFNNEVFANSHEQLAGSAVFSGAQDYSGGFSFTGAALTVNNAMESGGAVTVTNSALFSKAAAGGDINATGGFSQTGTGTSMLAAGITSANAPIAFAREIQLAGNIGLQSGGGNISLAAVTRDGTARNLAINAAGGAVNFSGNIGTLPAGLGSVSVSGSVINLVNAIQITTGTGNISLNGNIENTAARDFTLLAGTGNIIVNGGMGTSVGIGNILITSAAGASFSGGINAVSFTQSAGTGVTEFNGAQDYSAGFSFTGSVLTVNNSLVTNNAVTVTNSGNFNIGSSGNVSTRTAAGIINIAGSTVNGGTIAAGPVAAPSAGNLSVAINFGGNYTSSAAGIIVGSNTTTPDIQFRANVVLGALDLRNNRIVFAGNGLQQFSVAPPANPVIDGNVLVMSGSAVRMLSGSVMRQSDSKTLELRGENLSIDAAIFDVSEGSWHIGAGGTLSNDFSGINGELILGVNSKLIAHNVNLTGGPVPSSSFKITNTNSAFLTAKGNVDISANVILDGGGNDHFPLLVFEMDGNGVQNLSTNLVLGGLYVKENSQTVLSTANPDNTIYLRGEVKIFAIAAPKGLDAGNFDIVMYSGLKGSRNLAAYRYSGSDQIYYTRWEVTAAKYTAQPPFVTTPSISDFVFRQNFGNKISFRRDPSDSSSASVFFEIAGNTMWQEFECLEPGAVIQFSRNPDQHTILDNFKITGVPGNFVTITRLTDGSYDFPYEYAPSFMGPPPSSVNVVGQWALPAYYPPMDLKNAGEEELKKFWNINLVSSPNPAYRPLEGFSYVRIFFSHAYNQRIPIEATRMHLDVIPYYKPDTKEGFFNFDWIELRKILYSFTEDYNGNGRLDRIRVQTNLSLNGDFSGFDVNVEGYKINRNITGLNRFQNGFQMVSDFTGTGAFDQDSFYIYLDEDPDINTGDAPLWHVIRNSSLQDALTGTPVGDPEVDVNIKPFDTIPPRVAYSLTLPGYAQTYVRMTEPVVSDSVSGNSLIGSNPVETTPPYNFTWYYFPFDHNEQPVTKVKPVVQANLGYLLNWSGSFPVGELAVLKNLYGDTTSSPADGYFQIDNVLDQGQRAMDWSDHLLDEAFFIFYQPPKYPLNWGYTEYAKVMGNKHLLSEGLSDDTPEAARASGSIPVSDVFMPPNKMLTVEMMTTLADGNGDQITPSSFASYGSSAADSVYRRITDTLVSIPPGSVNFTDYFAWPVWARHKEALNTDPFNSNDIFWGQQPTDTGIIWEFDGTKYLEAFYLTERGDIEMQTRINSSLGNLNMDLELLWGTSIPERLRYPKIASVRGRNSGGLWLPGSNLLYYLAPLHDGNEINSLVFNYSNTSFPLYTYNFGKVSGSSRVDFIYRIKNSDMFIARLDAPQGAIPNDWYRLVRPFSFDIQDIRRQRGGVTILNNVINPSAQESTYIRYHLVRSGRVTIQIYTLDGTLVKSIRRNEFRAEGEYTDPWNGTNNGGRPVARGMYFVRVVAPDIDEIRKIMVVR